MTRTIDHRIIEQNLRYSRTLRAQAFGRILSGIGRGLRASARTMIGVFA